MGLAGDEACRNVSWWPEGVCFFVCITRPVVYRIFSLSFPYYQKQRPPQLIRGGEFDPEIHFAT